MDLENQIACFNEFYFFREFTYAINTQIIKGTEIELADNIVYLDGVTFIYQLKERDIENTSPDQEERWFKSKVLKKAKQQIKNTIKHLKSQTEIELTNQRKHSFSLQTNLIVQLHKVIIYRPNKVLPESCKNQKFYKSEEVGVIHLFSETTYSKILQTLLTPSEVANYLTFRENLAEKWKNKLLSVSEESLIGQYLKEGHEDIPSNKFERYFSSIDHQVEKWDMTGPLSIFFERTIYQDNLTDYYYIFKEIAKLNRSELTKFKERYLFSMDDARLNKAVKPYVMGTSRTNCGFVFIPGTNENKKNWKKSLSNYTAAFKYIYKLNKCVGVIFFAEENGWFDVNWEYQEGPWGKNEEMESLIKKNYPFRETFLQPQEKYKFNDNN